MRKIITAAASAAVIGGLAACGPSHPHHLAAKASALATSSAGTMVQATAQKDVQRCTAHLPAGNILHPVSSLERKLTAFAVCMNGYVAPAKRAAFDNCLQAAAKANGLGTGVLAKDETAGAACLAGQK